MGVIKHIFNSNSDMLKFTSTYTIHASSSILFTAFIATAIWSE